MVALKVAALVLLALLLPGAQAATTAISLSEVPGGVWNGVTRVETAGADARLFVPAEARLHRVVALVDGRAEPAAWRAAGADALVVDLPENATGAEASYDVRPSQHRLVRFVSPARFDAVALVVSPLGRDEPRSDGLAFTRADDAYQARTEGVGEGETFELRVVDPLRLSEGGVLLTLLVLALALVPLAMAWHRARPPLAGREPERFLDHLSELQARILPAAVAFLLLNILFFAVGLERGPLGARPTFGVEGSISARVFEAFAERLVPPEVDLVALRPVEAVLAQVQVTLFLAFAVVLPLLAYETAAFLGPALMPRERRIAGTSLPLVGALFAAGALFGLLVLAPLLIRTLYGYAPALGARPLLAVSDLVSFALLLLLAFGVAFELPVVMYLLSRFGLVGAPAFRKYFRHAIVVIVIAAGILTPDPSVVSQLIVALPVTGLYLVGIAAASVAQRQRARREATT